MREKETLTPFTKQGKPQEVFAEETGFSHRAISNHINRKLSAGTHIVKKGVKTTGIAKGLRGQRTKACLRV